MALSTTTFTGNGTTGPFNITFSYLESDDIEVFVDGVSVPFTFPTSSQIQLDSPAANGAVGLIKRTTDVDAPEVVYQDASTSKAADFNLSDAQLLYLIQEAQDNSPVILSLTGQASAQDLRIQDLGAPVDGTDAVTKDYVDALALGGSPGSIDGSIIQAGTIPADRMVANSITATQLAPDSVTSSELADNSVDAAAIQTDAVTTAKILNANVTTAKIADANVTTAKIADANITTAKILDANITTVKIADANVTFAKLAAAAIASQAGAEAGSASNVLMTPQRFKQGHDIRTAGCRVVLGSNTAITSGISLTIPFAAADVYDDASFHNPASNNTRMTIPADGRYMIVGQVAFSQATAFRYDATLLLGGATVIGTQSVYGVGGTSTTPVLQVSAILDFTAGQYVELQAYTLAASGNVLATQTHLTIQRLK